MYNYHVKLVERMVVQTPKAMFGLVVASSIYVWIYFTFIPFSFLMSWIFLQIMFTIFRLKNAQTLHKYIQTNNLVQLKKHIVYFYISIVLSAIVWNSAVIAGWMYAPSPYEFISLVMIIGIITAGVLSLASMYYVYITYFFLMIVPQLIIMAMIGDHVHLSVVLFLLIYVPVVVLLTKSIYSNQLSIIDANDSLHESVSELQKLSITDSLTGIHNRRHFFDASNRLISIAKREKIETSLIMIDIDHFKDVNDTYGHQFGDIVLIKMAEEIRKVIREGDVFARVGGEEFAILLHNSSLSDAKLIAQKIRIMIKKTEFTDKETSMNITLSMGVACLDSSNKTLENLYKAADERLYEAKESGRDRVN